MIHQFKNNGYNIVIDINSGAIHVVDEITYDFLGLWQEQGKDAALAQMKSSHPEVSEAELSEIQSEIEQLISDGALFTEDNYDGKRYFRQQYLLQKAMEFCVDNAVVSKGEAEQN